jgi:hypothetical protein
MVSLKQLVELLALYLADHMADQLADILADPLGEFPDVQFCKPAERIPNLYKYCEDFYII